MQGDTLDASQDVLIVTPVITFETEEECHNHLKTLHKEFDGYSLIWDKRTDPDQLLLLSKEKLVMRKCVPASIKFP